MHLRKKTFSGRVKCLHTLVGYDFEPQDGWCPFGLDAEAATVLSSGLAKFRKRFIHFGGFLTC